jgi:hypothetical protein
MINDILNYINSKLGVTHRELELDSDAIIRCLHQETLPTISIYFPFYCEYLLNRDLSTVNNSNNTFYLPDEIEGFRIMSVEKVFIGYNNLTNTSQLLGVLGASMTSAISNFVSMKMGATGASAFLPPETFQWIPPNILRVSNMYNNNQFVLTVRTTHRKDFSTLPFGVLPTIKQLALIDVCTDILGIRQYFQTLNTNFAELNLNVDALQNIVERREDFIEILRKNQLRNTGVKKIYLA